MIRNGFWGTAYAATKIGLVGLKKSTAALCNAQGIRCDAIVLGAVYTNFINVMKMIKVNENGCSIASKLSQPDRGQIGLD